MKIKNILLNLVFIFVFTIQLNAQNTNPEVTNVVFSMPFPLTTVTVTYNVYDAEQDEFTIIMLVSSNGGSTWDYNYGSATGDIGAGVTEGTNKTITWIYNSGYNPNFKVRIYANDETADGSPCPGLATVDYGGKTYNTIQIGTQCWLKENLDVGMKNTGTQNSSNNGLIEKYCYNDDDANCITYGGLYQWYEAMQYTTTPGTRGICPNGWHIPTIYEFVTLASVVGSNTNALKAIGQGSGNGAGTNTSGFSVMLGGYRYSSWGEFYNLNTSAYLWSSSVYSGTDYSQYISVYGLNSFLYYNYQERSWSFSIRCIKN